MILLATAIYTPSITTDASAIAADAAGQAKQREEANEGGNSRYQDKHTPSGYQAYSHAYTYETLMRTVFFQSSPSIARHITDDAIHLSKPKPNRERRTAVPSTTNAQDSRRLALSAQP